MQIVKGMKTAHENYRSEAVVGKALCNNYESRMHLRGQEGRKRCTGLIQSGPPPQSY